MDFSKCTMQIDADGRELVDHGSVLFPVACYDDDFSKENVPWHWHEELEAGIVTEGEIVIAVDSEKQTLRPGEAFFINSGALHGAWSAEKPEGKIHSLVFHPRIVGGSVDSIFWHDYVQPLMDDKTLKYLVLKKDGQWQQEIIEVLEHAWISCVEGKNGFEFEVRNDLSRFVFLRVQNKSGMKHLPSAKTLRDAARIKLMLCFIHEYFSEEITVLQIGESAGISESEALRCFRSTIGTTPMKYLKEFRIHKATELLAETDQKIVDIGLACGFQDMSYFARTFREMKGCTPSEFRRNSVYERNE